MPRKKKPLTAAQKSERYRKRLGPEKLKNQRAKHFATWSQRHPSRAMYNWVKQRAKRKGIEFALDPEDIVIPEKCPALGVPLQFQSKGPYSPSVDRIDPTQGYIKGNIVVISVLANQIKSTATQDQVARVAAWMSTL